MDARQTGLENIMKLALTPDIGPMKFRALIERFGSPEAVLNASKKDLASVNRIGQKTAQGILEAAGSDAARREIEKAAALGVEIIPCSDPRFPAPLLEISDPPILLYVKGNAAALSKIQIAIVGSRRNTFYGRSQGERIAAELGRLGLVVTSGLARGIDSAAHRGALKGGGQTVGVLGCGIDVVYPPENAELFEQVAASGAIVSELPFGTSPDTGNFPRRNRIISGVSAGVLVVEAGTKSGALITAKYAAEQGRPVFAMPGPVTSAVSRGTHQLLREGAALVEDALDIVREITPELMREKASSDGSSEYHEPEGLDADQSACYEFLGPEPRHMDFFAAKTGLPVDRVQCAMVKLLLKKLAKQLPGSLFVRSI